MSAVPPTDAHLAAWMPMPVERRISAPWSTRQWVLALSVSSVAAVLSVVAS